MKNKNIISNKPISYIITALALTFALALSGCGASNASNAALDGKTLNVAVITVADQPFDPDAVALPYVEQIQPIFDSLINVDENGNYTPGLATEWALSEDKLSFTLKLREGVKFHDGSTFTSADVKFSLENLVSEYSRQADKGLISQYIDSIDTPDDYTAVIHFKAPTTEFDYLLSEGSTGSGMIIPKDYFEKEGAEGFARKPIGTGPFKLVKFSAGDRIEFESNKDYWQGAPKYDKLILRQIADESTRIAELQAGNIDFAPVGATNATLFEDDGKLSIDTVDYTSTLGIFISGGYNNDGKASQNQLVRQALSLAIDRQAIVDGVFEGKAKAAGVWGVFPFTLGYDDDGRVAEYDVEKAKGLLKQANYPDAFANPVITLYDTQAKVYSSEVVQSVAAYWEAAGISVKIETIDPVTLSTEYSTEPLNSYFSGAAYLFDPPRKYSAHDAFGPFFPSTSYLKLIRGDDKLDQDVNGLLSQNTQERRATIKEILATVKDSGVAIPLVYPSTNYAVSEKVKSWNPGTAAHWGNWFYSFELNG